MKKVFVPALLFVVGWSLGCGGNQPGQRDRVSDVVEESVSQSIRFKPPAPKKEGRVGSRRIIRNASISIRVDDTEATVGELKRMVRELEGYVAESSSYREQDLEHHNLTLRVPAERLESVIDAVAEMATEVTHRNLRGEDVTERYVDLDARLRTLKATEAELQALLAESRSRGHDAEAIMAIYRHLTEIRSEAESLQGQLNLLENQTSLATLRVEVSPTESAKPIVGKIWRPLQTIRHSTRQLVSNLTLVADLAIRFVIAVLPIIIVIGVLAWLAIHFLGRFNAARRSAKKS